MKRMYIVSLIISLCFPMFAQNKITGKVIGADNEGIIYRVKVEYSGSKRAVTGSFYDPNFEIALDSLGDIRLTISSDGYETYQTQKTLQPATNDLGGVTLYKKTVQLEEVVVKAKKNEIEHNGTNYTIRNIQGTHIGDAGNLVDMLKWTPGIIVTNESNISVAGAGEPIIYINDRKITDKSELSMLSSTDVNKIEVIKEPDARYKNGTNSVVKIYLKKQLKDHLGVIVSNSLEIARKYTERPSINLSGKSGIVSGNASFTYRKSKQQSYDEYMTTITHSADNIFKNSSKGGYGVDMDTYMLFGGLNFTFSPKSTLGIQYSGSFTDVKKDSSHNIHIDNNGTVTPKKETSEGTENRKYHSVSTSYTWNRNDHSTLTLIADYAYRNNDIFNEIKETNLNTNKIYLTPTINSTDYKIYTFNGDYSFKIGKKDNEQIGLEAGNTNNNSGSTISEVPQNIDRTNQWLAAYATFSRGWGKFNISLGLRYEYDYTDTKAAENSESITLKKSYSNLFPNVRIAYKRKEREVYSISYRKTINRPSFSQLSPVVNYEDSLHYWTGNPLLKPSFTNRFSLAANISNLTLSTSYYYITNPIISIYGHDDANPNILVNRPENINHSQSWDIGVEYSLSLDKINLSTYGYLTYDLIKYPYLGEETLYKSLYASLGGNVSYNFYRNFDLFANTHYMSPWRDGTKKMGYFINTNLGISGRFFKDKLYVSIQGEDLFAKSVTPYWTNNYGDTEYWRRNRYDTRGVNFTLRYTFNSVKTNFKSKSGNQKILQRAD
nr:outer membrane beta-barrel family protein [uncultured Bacteroides sp.]